MCWGGGEGYIYRRAAGREHLPLWGGGGGTHPCPARKDTRTKKPRGSSARTRCATFESP
ncbi:hypothetical protein T492DRAFT_1011644 [Pavlovales sp. CCMP2436]|nr:hypothetical protein T492DRAFT_1011644 [Pavlovales sp. CCMP2436]